MQKVTLSGPHTHQGKPATAGDTIDVSDEEAKWLERRGRIAPTAVSHSPIVTAPQTGKKVKLENDEHVAD
ncbi:hypothetical protein JBO49_02885 [Serratia fonticola]|uniref:DUF7210 family protein n=1 Tax=Serratia fonticola TaxID=47917 RepID=UPI00192BE708|nr:hypothetical protein [Serratia fonticola]MBL5859557.1 hypothetical protein [Serratia fonticola]